MEKTRTNNYNAAHGKELQTLNALGAKTRDMQIDSNNSEQIGWKDLQREMRSSGVVTNMAALEVVKKKMSAKCEDLFPTNDSSECFVEMPHAISEVKVQDRINLKYPDKTKSLSWHQKKNFIKRLSDVGGKMSRSNSLSGDDFYDMLNSAVAADCPDAVYASSNNSSSWSSFSSFMKSFSDLKGEIISSKQKKTRSGSMSDDEFFSIISEAIQRDDLNDSFESLNDSENSLTFAIPTLLDEAVSQKGEMLETFPKKQRRRTQTARTA